MSDLTILSFDITPDVIATGETVAVSATLNNLGGSRVAEVVFTLGDETQLKTTIIDSGETKTVTAWFTPTMIGTVEVCAVLQEEF
jgi:hypothetical protein